LCVFFLFFKKKAHENDRQKRNKYDNLTDDINCLCFAIQRFLLFRGTDVVGRFAKEKTIKYEIQREFVRAGSGGKTPKNDTKVKVAIR
jgi:hypothetical protein